MKIIFSLILLVATLFSCSWLETSQEKYNKLEMQNREYAVKIRSLESELKALRNTPQGVFANAEHLYAEKETDSLAAIKERLEERYPQSIELIRIREMLANLDEDRQDIAKVEAMELQDLLNTLHIRVDKVNEVTWYENSYFTHVITASLFSVYIGKSDNNSWLRLKMSYFGREEILFGSAVLSSEKRKIYIPYNRFQDKYMEIRGSNVCEWINMYVTEDLLSLLRTIVNEKRLIMSFVGMFTESRELTANEIKALKEILSAYDALKGV